MSKAANQNGSMIANTDQLFGKQQMTETNKNKKTIKNSQPSIKIAFQANIFRYIQKKKQESSLFKTILRDTITKTPNESQSEPITNRSKQSNTILQGDLSNLIPPLIATRSKLLPRPGVLDQEMDTIQHGQNQPEQKVNVKQVNNIKKKQSLVMVDVHKRRNRHKYALSDWREMYEGRNQLSEKRLKSNNRNKMSVTDRLFYPTTQTKEKRLITAKILSSNMLEERKMVALKKRASSSFRPSNTISSFNFYKKSPERHASISNCQISNENILHMYHCSSNNLKNPEVSQQFLSDPLTKKYPSTKKLNNLLQKQQQQKCNGKKGLKQMNEGILQDGKVFSDLGFRTYQEKRQAHKVKSNNKNTAQQDLLRKWQSSQSAKMIDQNDVFQYIEQEKQHQAFQSHNKTLSDFLQMKSTNDGHKVNRSPIEMKNSGIITSLIPRHSMNRKVSESSQSKINQKFKSNQNTVERTISQHKRKDSSQKSKSFRSTLYERSLIK